MEDKKVGENDKAIFYENIMCRTIDDYRILVAEQKINKCREYVIINGGEIIYSNTNIEAIEIMNIEKRKELAKKDENRVQEGENVGRMLCTVWTRVMGYHRPTSSFNIGKKAEYNERVNYRVPTIKELEL